jgi:hypothetical protein
MGWGWLGSESQPSLHRHDKGEDDPREDLRRALRALTTRAKAKAEADATQVKGFPVAEQPRPFMAGGTGTGGVTQHADVKPSILAQGDLGMSIPHARSLQHGMARRITSNHAGKDVEPENLALVRAGLDMEFQHDGRFGTRQRRQGAGER